MRAIVSAILLCVARPGLRLQGRAHHAAQSRTPRRSSPIVTNKTKRHVRVSQRLIACRVGPAGSHRPRIRHAVLRLFARSTLFGAEPVPGGLRRPRSLVCYAMKANSNLAILNLFAGMGAGFDIVSGGELARVIAAGGDPGKVVFSGVGKSADEMRYALASGILCFNVESEAGAGTAGRRRGRNGKARAGLAPRQSRRRRRHASLHLHRSEGEQIRRRIRCRARSVPQGEPLAAD